VGARPPRIARAILSAVLPPDEQHAIVAELDYLYSRHVGPVS
jgi:hypothetical protein